MHIPKDVPLQDEIVRLSREEIPPEYAWSLRRVEEFPDWHETGSYLLIQDFEKTPAFREFYPHEVIE